MSSGIVGNLAKRWSMTGHLYIPFIFCRKFLLSCHYKQWHRLVLLTTECYFCRCTISYCTLFFLPIHPPTYTPTCPTFPCTQPLFITLSQVWSGFQDEVVLLSVLSNLLNSMAPFTTVCVCECVCVQYVCVCVCMFACV